MQMRIINGNLSTACQAKSDQNLKVASADCLKKINLLVVNAFYCRKRLNFKKTTTEQQN
jgi:hypothetical protein